MSERGSNFGRADCALWLFFIGLAALLSGMRATGFIGWSYWLTTLPLWGFLLLSFLLAFLAELTRELARRQAGDE